MDLRGRQAMLSTINIIIGIFYWKIKKGNIVTYENYKKFIYYIFIRDNTVIRVLGNIGKTLAFYVTISQHGFIIA